jgi:hypothetical protein
MFVEIVAAKIKTALRAGGEPKIRAVWRVLHSRERGVSWDGTERAGSFRHGEPAGLRDSRKILHALFFRGLDLAPRRARVDLTCGRVSTFWLRLDFLVLVLRL